MPSTVLADRYRLDSLIGAGSVGQVWKGTDLTLQREVAIKTLDLRTHHEDPEVLARFRREAVATAGLKHPNIVTVYDAGEDGDFSFLVMELCSGPVLSEVLREKGPFTYPEGLALMRQVADGLAAAHSLGLTHRDIKPGNIMLNNGQPKIVDFGIARLGQNLNQTLTRPSMAIGTPAYISPEQAMGQRATPASDMYSFGCVLMAVFTGRPPFEAEQPLALVRAHVTAVPPRLAELRPGCPPALDELINRLLDKRPERRPDAAETSAILGRIAEQWASSGSPTVALPAATTGTMVMPATAALDESRPRRAAPEPTEQDSLVPQEPEPPAPPVLEAGTTPQSKRQWGWLILGILLLIAAVIVVATQLFGRQPAPGPTPTTTVTVTTLPSPTSHSPEPPSIAPTTASPTAPTTTAPTTPTQTTQTTAPTEPTTTAPTATGEPTTTGTSTP